MARKTSTSHFPFERLRTTLERRDRRCQACGYDDDGTWDVTTSGGRVRYRFDCPVCAATHTRDVELS